MARVTSAARGFAGPMQYIQGAGEFRNIREYARELGDRAFYLVDPFLHDEFATRLRSIYDSDPDSLVIGRFGGECSLAEVARVKALAAEADVFVGVGGGKTLDAAKIAAAELRLPLVIAPTSAATDAPTSALAVIYSEEGEHRGSIKNKRHAELVLIDTEIIAKAPLRLFVAGMGDALATYFEARANAASDSANYVGQGYRTCKAAMAIARLSYDILMESGVQAKIALERGICSEAVEDVIEANTLLSGLGFENTGCAAAHGIHAGLCELPETHDCYHGEKVAFGLLCQLVMENAPKAELQQILDFCAAVGLPITLRQLRVEPTPDKVRIIADKVVNGNTLVYAQPFLITEDFVYNAILAADAIGTAHLEQCSTPEARP